MPLARRKNDRTGQIERAQAAMQRQIVSLEQRLNNETIRSQQTIDRENALKEEIERNQVTFQNLEKLITALNQKIGGMTERIKTLTLKNALAQEEILADQTEINHLRTHLMRTQDVNVEFSDLLEKSQDLNAELLEALERATEEQINAMITPRASSILIPRVQISQGTQTQTPAPEQLQRSQGKLAN